MTSVYNTTFLKKIEAASQNGAFGMLDEILAEYTATREVVSTYENGIQKVRYIDSNGLLLGELHEVDPGKKVIWFEAELKKLGITQNEFCEAVGLTAAGVIKWKRTGQWPKWVKWAIAGMHTEK